MEEIERERKALAELRGFDPKTLTPQQRVSAGLIEWSLEQDIVAGDYLDHEFMFQQMNGLQVLMVRFMSQQHPLRHARDVQSYLERLAALAPLMDQGIARAKSAQARGVLMPRFITEKVITQFETFLAPPPAQNLLVSTLAERLVRVPGLSAGQVEAARAQAEKIVAEALCPAWARGLALMNAQLPQTTGDAGAWRLPDGARYYAASLRQMTTTDYTPAEIHALGLAQVARIEAQMDGLLSRLGYAEGSVKERYRKMNEDRQPTAADPRPELLARYTGMVRDAEARAPAGLRRVAQSARRSTPRAGADRSHRRRPLHAARTRRLAAGHRLDPAAGTHI